MNKLKIAVYAICKNEEKFVEGWLKSMSEADYICVLDTGSTDKTVELLKKHPKVILQQKVITPWRFDVARNESLKLIPADVDFCACIDLDETFNKGWRKIVEGNVSKNDDLILYRYTWNFNPDGTEGIVFYANKFHKNKKFCWKHPVHEVVVPLNPNEKIKTVLIKNLQLNHHADNTKSRGQYLPLLELSVKEDPNDDRNVHYLAREYYFYKMYDKAIKMFKKHLSMKNSTWADERAASLRYLAKAYIAKGNNRLAEKYFIKAVAEKPDIRENLFELGKFYYNNKNWEKSAAVLLLMKNINERKLTYMSDPCCWNGMPDDLLSICFYNLKNKQQAIKHCLLALEYDKTNLRLKNNLQIFNNMK